MVSRCFPGGYNVKLYISRGRLAWWSLAFLHCEYKPSYGWFCCQVTHSVLGWYFLNAFALEFQFWSWTLKHVVSWTGCWTEEQNVWGWIRTASNVSKNPTNFSFHAASVYPKKCVGLAQVACIFVGHMCCIVFSRGDKIASVCPLQANVLVGWLRETVE